jgi:hypothetical protein
VHDTEEAAEATAGEEDNEDVASQANKEALVMVIARCEVATVSLILIYKLFYELKLSHDSNLIKSSAIDQRWMPMGNMRDDISYQRISFSTIQLLLQSGSRLLSLEICMNML